MWTLCILPLALTHACLSQGQLKLASRRGNLQGLNAEICWPELIPAEGQACLHELLSQQPQNG